MPKLRAAVGAARGGVAPRSARRRWSREHAAVGQATPLLPTYARSDVTFVSGEGVWLTDADGKRYLDLLAGIAVVSLGHRHPAPLAAAKAQLDALWHVSNLYSTEPMARLASLLSDRFGGAEAFFCNSGAEANEAALKWARKATGKSVVVALEGSFHGRTHGALAVTGQPAKRAAWEPLAPPRALRDAERHRLARGRGRARRRHDPRSSPCSARAASSRSTPEFLAAARALADEHEAMLVFDEVQCGLGRTGSFFAWQQLGVRPDAVTLAKALANGLPIGRAARRRRRSDRLRARRPRHHVRRQPGHRAPRPAPSSRRSTTSCSPRVAERGTQLSSGVAALPGVVATRGRGLMLGADLDRPAGPVAATALELGLVVGTAGERTLRFDAAADDHGGRARPGSVSSRGGARMNKFERQGAILRLVQEQELSTQADVARALEPAGARRGAGDDLARHLAARPRQGAQRATAGSSTRCPAPPTSTASAS